MSSMSSGNMQAYLNGNGSLSDMLGGGSTSSASSWSNMGASGYAGLGMAGLGILSQNVEVSPNRVGFKLVIR